MVKDGEHWRGLQTELFKMYYGVNKIHLIFPPEECARSGPVL